MPKSTKAADGGKPATGATAAAAKQNHCAQGSGDRSADQRAGQTAQGAIRSGHCARVRRGALRPLYAPQAAAGQLERDLPEDAQVYESGGDNNSQATDDGTTATGRHHGATAAGSGPAGAASPGHAHRGVNHLRRRHSQAASKARRFPHQSGAGEASMVRRKGQSPRLSKAAPGPLHTHVPEAALPGHSCHHERSSSSRSSSGASSHCKGGKQPGLNSFRNCPVHGALGLWMSDSCCFARSDFGLRFDNSYTFI